MTPLSPTAKTSLALRPQTPTRVAVVGAGPVGMAAALACAALVSTGTALAQATVMLLGQVRVGAVASLTVIVWVQVAELPQASVAR